MDTTGSAFIAGAVSTSRAMATGLFLALMITFGGCAPLQNTPNVSRNYVLSETGGMGLVVGTITSSGQLADYRIFYRRIGGRDGGFFHLQSNDPSLSGALIAAKLPAGDYEIYDWEVYWGGLNGMEGPETVAAERFSIPFHVAPGHAVYIGNCDFQVSTLIVTCSDNFERDLMEFDALYPNLRSDVEPVHGRGLLYRSNGYSTRGVPPEPAIGPLGPNLSGPF